ncbi:MAG: response regulator [Agriterribacter sp.]
MLRILISDNYKIVRKGIIEVIKETFRTAHIAEVADTEALTQRAITEPWDVIIADIGLSNADIDALKTIKRWRPYLPVVIYSEQSGDHFTIPVLSAGATACLHKGSSVENLSNAIKDATSWLN